METVKANRHVAIGLGILLAVTLMLGWFVGRFIPGEPQSLHEKQSYRIYPTGSATYIPASEVKEAALGSVARIEGLMQGGKYTKTQPCVVTSPDGKKGERREFVEEFEVTHTDMIFNEIPFPSFELAVEGARSVSFGAFAEWYPDFIERGGAMEEGLVPEFAKIVLVDVVATNLSDDRDLRLDYVQLASDAFNQVSPGCLGNGCSVSGTALDAMYGVPRHQAGEAVSVPFSTLGPGETRTLTLPYVVSSSYFVDAADFDKLDLARFSLEIGDYATGTLHRFALA